jgi:hypothetical protein
MLCRTFLLQLAQHIAQLQWRALLQLLKVQGVLQTELVRVRNLLLLFTLVAR